MDSIVMNLSPRPEGGLKATGSLPVASAGNAQRCSGPEDGLKADGRPLPEGSFPSADRVSEYATPSGMRVARYALPLEEIPADFFADPDGSWTYESLVAAAGFSAADGVAIGALKTPFRGHPDGAAVITLNARSRPYVAIVECPIAYHCVEEDGDSTVSAA